MDNKVKFKAHRSNRRLTMPVYKAPIRDFKFALHEWINIAEHEGTMAGYEDLSLVDPILEESARFCEEVLFPLNQAHDAEGLKFENGMVTTPAGFKEAYQSYIEMGWGSLTFSPDYGGQGLPNTLNMPLTEMICSTHLSFGLLPGLTHGAITALDEYGTDELKRKFKPKMVSGVWSGVMCLTEPQAGTDLGLINTRAEPQEDGSYNITGSKIFISYGEHDASENIIHLILARTPGSPEGMKGISLFVAPRNKVADDGTVGENNGITCGSIEHKMGIHASPTCVMNYENAEGWLIGNEFEGMKAMFVLMNEARLLVGVQGLGIGEIAYQNSLNYAKERPQGRALKGAAQPDKKADPITVHPDVRRMLLTQRSFTEGARILANWAALKVDIRHRHTDEKLKAEADDWIQLMTPIIKAYMTDGGSEIANLGMQIHGGYGYIGEYGMEQYVRDVRITQIYEGTNGIQALDLVGRKLGMHMGRYLRSFTHPCNDFIEEHREDETMAEFTKPLYGSLKSLQQASLWIGQKGMSNPDEAAGASVDYLRMFSLVVMGYIWARSAKIAQDALAAGSDEKLFYESKIATARFFLNKILPEHYSLLAKITAGVKFLDIPDVDE
jgi:alkylation response protein AidB-like acyl-CoA dehydrogenase